MAPSKPRTHSGFCVVIFFPQTKSLSHPQSRLSFLRGAWGGDCWLSRAHVRPKLGAPAPRRRQARCDTHLCACEVTGHEPSLVCQFWVLQEAPVSAEEDGQRWKMPSSALRPPCVRTVVHTEELLYQRKRPGTTSLFTSGLLLCHFVKGRLHVSHQFVCFLF